MAKKKTTIRQDGAYRIKSAETRSSPATSQGTARTSTPTSSDRLISSTLRKRLK